MKNLIVIVTTIFLLNSVCYSKGSKIIKQTEVDKFKETFTYGSYKEKKEALNDIHLVDKTVAFDIIKLELENYKWLNLREEVTEKLIYIDIERTTPLVWKYLGDSIYNRRLEILSGIARANNKKLINTVDKYRPKNIKEKIIIAYIYCKYKIRYKENISYLISIVKDKQYYKKGVVEVGEENYDGGSYAVYYLELLGDKKALPALNKALEWADGAYGEIISEAIINIKNNSSRSK